jgi:hypothetical protein
MGDGTRCHGVIAVNTALFIRYNKSATGSAKLIRHRSTLEPLIQYRFATGKVSAAMV